MKKFDINEKVIALMKEKGINELQVAETLNKPASSIYRITALKNVPTQATLQLLADAYQVDLTYFYGATEKSEFLKCSKNDVRFWMEKYDQLFQLFTKTVENMANQRS